MKFLLCLFFGLYLTACSFDDASEDQPIAEVFNKKVTVYGIPIYATSNVSDASILHAAKVMAKYLDSNDDGTVNSTAVLGALQNSGAGLSITADASESEQVLEKIGGNSRNLQELYQSEMAIPNGTGGKFDFTLEEVLHLITQNGYSKVHNELAETKGSDLANAMDTARGGYHETPPTPYPPGAWYTYNDASCEYSCMITEYIYWGLTSYLGGQQFAGRLEQIQHEWSLNTAVKLQGTDTALHTILTNAAFAWPTVLPDGEYTSVTFEITPP